MSIANRGAEGVHSTRFHQAVAINEEVKRVVKISNEVNLAAINAMLIAKRSGRSAAGFGVVSVELRAFSQQLDRVMVEVGAVVASLVVSGATLCRQRQRQRILQQVAGDLASTPLLQKEEIINVIGQKIGADIGCLLGGLGKALRLCAIGGAISRSAKIESVHCRQFATELQQVAEQVAQAIEGMMGIVKALQQQLLNEYR